MNQAGQRNGCMGLLGTLRRYQPELDNFRIEALPAHLDVLLWRDQPKDISEPPVMRFTVRFL